MTFKNEYDNKLYKAVEKKKLSSIILGEGFREPLLQGERVPCGSRLSTWLRTSGHDYRRRKQQSSRGMATLHGAAPPPADPESTSLCGPGSRPDSGQDPYFCPSLDTPSLATSIPEKLIVLEVVLAQAQLPRLWCIQTWSPSFSFSMKKQSFLAVSTPDTWLRQDIFVSPLTLKYQVLSWSPRQP